MVGDELMASSDAPTLLLAAGVLHNLNAALFGPSGLGSMAGPFARVPTRAAKNAIHLLLLYTSGAMTSTLEADIINTAASRIQAVLRGNGRLTHNQCCVMLSQPSSAVQQRRASGGFQTQPAVVHLTIVRAQKWNQGPTSVDYKRCPAWLTWKRQTGCVRCGEAFHVEVDHVNAHGVLVLRSQCPLSTRNLRAAGHPQTSNHTKGTRLPHRSLDSFTNYTPWCPANPRDSKWIDIDLNSAEAKYAAMPKDSLAQLAQERGLLGDKSRINSYADPVRLCEIIQIKDGRKTQHALNKRPALIAALLESDP